MITHFETKVFKVLLFLTLSVFLNFPLTAKSRVTAVYFFATTTSTPDDPTIKLTENLFFTQFQSENLTVIDMRPANLTDYTQGTVTISDLTDSSILFSLDLQKNNNEWVCRMNLLHPESHSPVSYENSYESYYKILMDAKSLISQVIDHVPSEAAHNITQDIPSKSVQNNVAGINLDALAGTWKGESLIDKIIILRSGRGFVIFNNGASMNISITIRGNRIEAVQTGKPNASFFPDLPRETALIEAAHAEPVAWSLSISDPDTLNGTKTTLLPSDDNEKSAERRSISVTWKRL